MSAFVAGHSAVQQHAAVQPALRGPAAAAEGRVRGGGFSGPARGGAADAAALRDASGRARPEAERRREAARGAGARDPQGRAGHPVRRGHLVARLAHRAERARLAQPARVALLHCPIVSLSLPLHMACVERECVGEREVYR